MVSYDISKGLVISSNLGPSSTSDPSFDGVNDASWFGIWLSLTWAQVSEDKVGAGLVKGYVFTAALYLRLSCSFWSFMDCPNF